MLVVMDGCQVSLFFLVSGNLTCPLIQCSEVRAYWKISLKSSEIS